MYTVISIFHTVMQQFVHGQGLNIKQLEIKVQVREQGLNIEGKFSQTKGWLSIIPKLFILVNIIAEYYIQLFDAGLMNPFS